MSDPALALQIAMNGLLRSDAACNAIQADRVYDRVQQNATFPYSSFGPSQTLDDGAQCVDAQECYLQVDCWSRAVGQTEVKRLAAAVRGVLHDAELDLGPDWQFLGILHHDTRYLTGPDGLTSHAVVTFRALTASA